MGKGIAIVAAVCLAIVAGCLWWTGALRRHREIIEAPTWLGVLLAGVILVLFLRDLNK